MYNTRKEFEKNTSARYTNLSTSSHVDLIISHYGFENLTNNRKIVTSKGYPLFRLHFIQSGEIFLTFGSNRIKIGKNNFFLLSPQLDITFESNPLKPAIHYWVSFSGHLASQYIHLMGFTDERPYGLLDKASTTKVFNILFQTLQQNENKKEKLFLFYEHFFFLCSIVQQSIQPKVDTDNQEYKSHRHVNRTIEYINSNYQNPNLSISEVANHLGLHVHYLSRIFKSETSVTFVEYLTTKRIETAIDLIAKGMTSVSDIAYAVGFKDPLYFSTVFRKYNLISPSQHIKKMTTIKDH